MMRTIKAEIKLFDDFSWFQLLDSTWKEEIWPRNCAKSRKYHLDTSCRDEDNSLKISGETDGENEPLKNAKRLKWNHFLDSRQHD
jgi:hypothetical protein